MSGQSVVGRSADVGVLLDVVADRALRSAGYVVLPFLDAEEVSAIRDRQQELGAGHEDGLVIDFLHDDRSAMRRVHDLLAPMWERKLGNLFHDHRVVVSTFIVKHPGPASVMAMHREPTFVDSDALTFNTWIPLVDVDAQRANGVLRLIPGSELLPEGLVGFNTPPTFRFYEEALAEASIGVDVPAGSVLVYDTRMLHWSEANTSNASRPAIAAAVAPAGVPLVHVVATGRRGRQIYEVEPDFFLDLHPAEVADEIAANHALIRQTEEAPSVTPGDVAAALGLAVPPLRRTIVPADVASGDASWSELAAMLVRGAALPAHDVTATAAALTGAETWQGIEVRSQASAAALDLDAAATLLEPAVLRGLRSLAGSGPAVVVALDPGGRLAFAAVPPVRVAVYEAPELRAGLICGRAAGHLTPGFGHDLAPGAEVMLWNDGPGPVWLVVAPR